MHTESAAEKQTWTTETVVETGKSVFQNTYAQLPIVLNSGEGCRVKDLDGNEYLDFVAGIAVNALGYGDEELKKALAERIETGITHCSNLYWNLPSVEAASLISRISGLKKTFFCNSGAEANEAAMKLARKYGAVNKGISNPEIISMKQSFHGRTYGAITATGQPKYHKNFTPLMPGIHYADYNDTESVKALISDKTCAIIVEPLQGEGGIIPAEESFLQDLRSLCDAHDLLLIFDEVQCGMGRLGAPFAFQHFGVVPDIVTLAKGLGAGLPIGAMAAGEKAADIFEPGNHAATFGGNLLSCTAACIVLSRLARESFMENIRKSGKLLTDRLLALKKEFPVISEVRGIGLMQGMELTGEAAPVIKAAMKKGLLLIGAGKQVIRFVPPLIVSEDEVNEACDILRDAFAEVYA